MTYFDIFKNLQKPDTDKEDFFRKGIPTILNGGEEDLLAFYLANNRNFTDEPSLIVLDNDLWNCYKNNSTVSTKKEIDRNAKKRIMQIEKFYKHIFFKTNLKKNQLT